MKQPISADRNTFEKLYNETFGMVYFIAHTILQDDEDAQRAVTESYITAFTGLFRLDDPADYPGLMGRITADRCIEKLRGQNPNFLRQEHPDRSLADIPEQGENFLPGEYVTQNEKRMQVMAVVGSLPAQQRVTVLLYYYIGLSLQEIAAAMKCKENQAAARIGSAKKFIRRETERRGYHSDGLPDETGEPFLTSLLRSEAGAVQIPQYIQIRIWRGIIAAVQGEAAEPETSAVERPVTQELSPKSKAKNTHGGSALPLRKKIALAAVAALIVAAIIEAPALKKLYQEKIASPKAQETEMAASPSASAEPSEAAQGLSPQQASAYYDILSQVESQYGIYSATKTVEEAQALLLAGKTDEKELRGLAYVSLLDMDGDGSEELLFYYLHPNENSTQSGFPLITAEVYRWNGENAEECMNLSDINTKYTPASLYATVSEQEYGFTAAGGKTYLFTSSRDYDPAGLSKKADGDLTAADSILLTVKNIGSDDLAAEEKLKTTITETKTAGQYGVSYTVSENDSESDSGTLTLKTSPYADTGKSTVNWDSFDDKSAVARWRSEYGVNGAKILIGGSLKKGVLGWTTTNDPSAILDDLKAIAKTAQSSPANKSAAPETSVSPQSGVTPKTGRESGSNTDSSPSPGSPLTKEDAVSMRRTVGRQSA